MGERLFPLVARFLQLRFFPKQPCGIPWLPFSLSEGTPQLVRNYYSLCAKWHPFCEQFAGRDTELWRIWQHLVQNNWENNNNSNGNSSGNNNNNNNNTKLMGKPRPGLSISEKPAGLTRVTGSLSKESQRKDTWKLGENEDCSQGLSEILS